MKNTDIPHFVLYVCCVYGVYRAGGLFLSCDSIGGEAEAPQATSVSILIL